MQVHYDEGVAIHIGPEPCAGAREGVGEASAGECTGQPLSRERPIIPGADAVPIRGRPHGRARHRERPDDPAWSETLACADAPCTGTGRSRGWPAACGMPRSGPHREGEEPKPMMHDREKSDSAIVAMKPTNKAGRTGGGAGGAKGGDRGERGPAKHAPDTEPGTRVTGAGPRTASRKAKEEGEVHRAPPPPQRRSAPRGVLRAQARCRPRRGRADVADLRGRP